MYVLATVVALRLLNPNDLAVHATLRCGEDARWAVRLEARELRDVDGCASAEAFVPLVAIETSFDGEREWQHVLDADAECGTASMAVPLFACRNGVATAYVAPVDGATYAWNAEGAVITAGANTSRVLVQLGDAATAKLTCVITTEECTKSATGVIGVREPIVVKNFTVPATADANQPLTITWSYEPGREPATQMLTGDLFAQPVTLTPQQRSYTTTPQNGGARSVELRASYGRAIHVTPLPKKRRRSVGGGVTATECPSALATARIDVRGCVSREPVVQAPFDVAAGSTFEALIPDLDDDDKVQWSVDNGTISYLSPFGERALVVAGISGKTDVHARVERSAGCFANGSAAVGIIRPAGQCAIAPSAALTLVSTNCNGALVRASFTGTPPFAGRWSDGTEFRTSADYAHHEFSTTGTYGMTEFHDGACFGGTTGSPQVTMLRPTVKLTGVEGCAGGALTATFSGNPPFSGTWSDGQSFTTSNATLTRTVGEGTWSVQNLTDVTCSTAKASSNNVAFGPRPRAWIPKPATCYLPSVELVGYVPLETAGGNAPYVYEFTDGAVFTTNSAKTYREVRNTSDVQNYELKRVTAAGCEATLENRVVTVHRRHPATIPGGRRVECTQTDITVPSIWEPSLGAQINWGVWGSGFKPAAPVIVSGERTTAITFRSKIPGTAYLTVETRWPDGLCYYRAPTQDVEFVVCNSAEK
ncbi:MAG TPA: hypothetical protein VGQ36_25595 [Thermoanaerobaculia bacterium]|jgi:hypothetical protein|nr:hypothetical protein [Thermoanaerobaculia bacterium]